MSIGPMNPISLSTGGTQSAQSGASVSRAKQDQANQQRQVTQDQAALDAAGIAETDGQGHETNERDADGRRAWEIPAGRGQSEPNEEAAPAPQAKSHDADSGQQLDLSG